MMSTSSSDDLARREIARIHGAFEAGRDACSDTFEPQLNDDGSLVLDLGEKGQYGLQLAPNGQLLLFSPLTGPVHYEYDPENDWWRSPHDGHLMVELLVRELMHITSVYIDL